MVKKKEKSVNVSGKPKHSLDANRDGGSKNKGGRTSATVRRLKMYNTQPKRNPKGKIIRHDLQSKELPSTRIQPDRRWFGKQSLTNFDSDSVGLDWKCIIYCPFIFFLLILFFFTFLVI